MTGFLNLQAARPWHDNRRTRPHDLKASVAFLVLALMQIDDGPRFI
jgi:hypothetical protein